MCDVSSCSTRLASDSSSRSEEMSEFGVLHDRLEQTRQVRPVAPAGRLALQLAQEELLALDAPEVEVLVVTEAHEAQRAVAVQKLIAGVEVDRLVVVLKGMVVAVVDLQVDAAQQIHDVGEAAEVDVDEVVDRQPEHVAQREQRQRRPALGVGGVDLAHAVAGDVYPPVSRH